MAVITSTSRYVPTKNRTGTVYTGPSTKGAMTSSGGGSLGVAVRPSTSVPAAPAPATKPPVAIPAPPSFTPSRPPVFNSGGGGSSAPPVTNTSQNNPLLTNLIDTYKGALDEQHKTIGTEDPLLQEQVGNLRDRLSEDTTERAQNRAMSQIMDQGTAQRDAAIRMAASTGGAVGGDVGLGQMEAARRRSAGAAADIALDSEKRKDALVLGGQAIMAAPGSMTLQERGMYNAMLGNAGQLYSKPAELGLQERGLGVTQWNAQNQNALARDQMALQVWQAQQQQQMAQYNAYIQALSALF